MTEDNSAQGQVALPAAAEEAHTESHQDEPNNARPVEEMQTLMDGLERDYRSPQRGEVLEGIIVSVDKDGILVDIGTKSEGIIPSHEVQAALQDQEDGLGVGEEVLVYVVQSENRDGHVVLSLRRARAERGWRQIEKRHAENAIIEAEVIDCNKGGLIVNVGGLRGFVPSSQVVGFRQGGGEGVDERLAAMVGRQIHLKVLEINRRRNRLILSERAAVQDLRQRRKEELLEELEPGQLRHGRVSSICDFGAFVDLGGADGLVHISELAWSPTAHPSEVIAVGQEIDVQVIAVDRDKKKIALSLRRAQPEPWSTIAERYNVGDEIEGKVTKIASFGAFARVEDGVEGLVHISELSDGRINHPRNVVQEGAVLTFKVIRVEPERRRLGLSLKQATQREPVEEKEQGDAAQPDTSVDSSQGTAAAVEPVEEPAESTAEQAQEQPDTE